MRRGSWMCVGFIFGLLAAAGAPSNEVTTVEPDWGREVARRGSPSLLSWGEISGRCEWAVFEPPTLARRVFLRTARCPTTLVWNKAGGQSLFALDGVIYLHDWQAATVTALGPPPVNGVDVELGFSNRGVPRFCEFQDRPVPGDPGRHAQYRVLWEKPAQRSWQRVGEAFINHELIPPETCGGRVALYDIGSVQYNPQPQVANECTGGEPPTLCPSRAAIERFKSRLSGAYDGYEYLRFSERSFLAYPYAVGDWREVVGPVFAIEGEQLSKLYDRTPRDTLLDVLWAGDHVLVREQSTLARASVFERGRSTARIEFPETTRVVWIPGSVALAPVIEMGR